QLELGREIEALTVRRYRTTSLTVYGLLAAALSALLLVIATYGQTIIARNNAIAARQSREYAEKLAPVVASVAGSSISRSGWLINVEGTPITKIGSTGFITDAIFDGLGDSYAAVVRGEGIFVGRSAGGPPTRISPSDRAVGFIGF